MQQRLLTSLHEAILVSSVLCMLTHRCFPGDGRCSRLICERRGGTAKPLANYTVQYGWYAASVRLLRAFKDRAETRHCCKKLSIRICRCEVM